VEDLKEAVKKRLANQLGDVDVNRIILRKHGQNTDLEPYHIVDNSFTNTAKTPLQVIVQGKDQMEEEKQGN